MRRDSSRIATRFIAAIAGAACLAMLSGCKSRDPGPATSNHAPATPSSTAPPAERPEFHIAPEPTFELPDDVAADPAEELRAMRHNCCDEMPAAEIEAATRTEEPAGATTAPPQRKHGRTRDARRSR
jgi:hypothetical protein